MPATVYAPESRIDERVRRTRMARVADSTVALLKERLLAFQPRLESHSRIKLRGCQDPGFLLYRPGDFFCAHQDRGEGHEETERVRERQISLVVFLNAQSQKPEAADTYCGGSLVFYGLMDHAAWQTRGLPLAGEPGMLVAFRSDVRHEVTAVTAGERCTIVSWFV